MSGTTVPPHAQGFQELLSELEQVYRDSPIGLFSFDREFRFLRINTRMAGINGLPVEAHIGRSMREIVPDLAEPLEKIMRPVLDIGTPVLDLEIRGRTRSQPEQDLVWLVNYFPMRDAAGRIVGLFGAVLDITLRKNVEEALRLSEHRFRQLFQTAPIGNAVVSLDGRFEDVNTAMCRLTGHTKTELQALTFQQITDPRDLGLDLQRLDALRRGVIDAYQIEKRYIRGDGSSIWAELNVSLVRDEAGAPVHYLSQVQDISQRKASQDHLKGLARRYALALRAGEIGVWEWDVRTGVIQWDAQMYEIYGLSSDAKVDYERWQRAVVSEDRASAGAILSDTVDSQRASESSFRIQHPDRGLRYIEAAQDVVLDEQGEAILVVGVNRDVTDARSFEARLRESEERFRLMVDSVVDYAIVMLTPDGRVQNWNMGAQRITGFKANDIIGANISKLYPSDAIAAGLPEKELDEARATGRFEDEGWRMRKNGSRFWANVVVSAVRDENGLLRGFCKVTRDLTERKKSEMLLAQLAHYDALTALANRTRLSEEADRMIAEATRSEARLAVMFMDLDHFKDVNDTLGHDAGDQLLKHVAHNLIACTRTGDCVARLGGDEFVIVLGGISGSWDVVRVAESILERLRVPTLVAGQILEPRMSIGASIFPEDGLDRQTLFRCADSALYQAKAEGRNNLQFYRPELTEQLETRSRMERDLRQAVPRGELRLRYERIVRLDGRQDGGVEALLRWQHPQFGLLRPDHFIGVAEDSGMIVPIGEWVLQAAARHASDSGERVAVNISPRQFKSDALVHLVQRALAENGLTGERLCLEITEQCLLLDTEHTLDVLAQLRALGVRIAIDDFGTGYSSMRYIKRFSPHILKIDRSFIREVADDPDDAAIVKAVIALAHSLRIEVVAEGVETERQREFVEQAGCEYAQGWLFSPPDATWD
jgi:diguanylate cyclase (GGDEF)-like protein/PAS domain S-box-containing protein